MDMKRKLAYNNSLALKNWCFWTVVLAESFESPLGWKRIQPVYPKGISPESSWEGLMLKLKLQYFGHLMQRTDFLKKVPDAGNDWRHGEKGTKEDEIVRWHHWLDGLEFEEALGVGDRQASLGCCSPWGPKELDTTERLSIAQHRKSSKQSISMLPLLVAFLTEGSLM